MQRQPGGTRSQDAGISACSRKDEWISPAVAQEFARARTDAYRIADGETCRIERFGDGAIVSYCAVIAARDRRRACGLVPTDRSHASKMYAPPGSAPGRHDLPEALGSTAPPHSGIAHEEGLAMKSILQPAIHGLFPRPTSESSTSSDQLFGNVAKPLLLYVFVFGSGSGGGSANRQRRSGKIRA